MAAGCEAGSRLAALRGAGRPAKADRAPPCLPRARWCATATAQASLDGGAASSANASLMGSLSSYDAGSLSSFDGALASACPRQVRAVATARPPSLATSRLSVHALCMISDPPPPRPTSPGPPPISEDHPTHAPVHTGRLFRCRPWTWRTA